MYTCIHNFICFINSNICSGGKVATALLIASGAFSGSTGSPYGFSTYKLKLLLDDHEKIFDLNYLLVISQVWSILWNLYITIAFLYPQ